MAGFVQVDGVDLFLQLLVAQPIYFLLSPIPRNSRHVALDFRGREVRVRKIRDGVCLNRALHFFEGEVLTPTSASVEPAEG